MFCSGFLALASYFNLPPEQLKQDWEGQIGLLSRQKLKRALINAVREGRLTFTEAQEIASIFNPSLYNR